jgi:hypothetical protein
VLWPKRFSPARPGWFHALTNGNTVGMSSRTRSGSGTAATIIIVIADIMAFILALWILMYLLDANRANDLVNFIQDAARWLAGWSYDLFTFDKAWARVVCGYGLPAVVYLLVGHGLAGRLRRV